MVSWRCFLFEFFNFRPSVWNHTCLFLFVPVAECASFTASPHCHWRVWICSPLQTPGGARTVTAMVQQSTASKKKGPPKFQHLPRPRGKYLYYASSILLSTKNSHERDDHSAKQLKFAWIQTRKIKSKWKAEKRREMIQSVKTAPELGIPVSNVPVTPDQKSDHLLDSTENGSDGLPSRSEKQKPLTASNSRKIREPITKAKTGPAVGSSQQEDHRSGRHDSHRWSPSGYRGKKPNMRSRMNALLEKIQREIG